MSDKFSNNIPRNQSSSGQLGETSSCSKTSLDDLESLLAQPSSREKEKNKITQEIMDLLNKKSAKELSLAEKFKSDGTQVQEFCPRGTKENCRNFAKSCGEKKVSNLFHAFFEIFC